MSYKLTCYKVFIASPGGLEDERIAFAKEVEEYNKNEALPRNVLFQAVGWEDTLPGLGRPQTLINKDLEQCDFFILVLHDRWGSNPGENKRNATSGTEEEYLLALECYKDSKYPMKQLVCLFKSVPPNQLADPGIQLKKILQFKRKIEKEKSLLYKNFSSLEEFNYQIRRNLAKWLRDDNDGGNSDETDQLPPDLPINDSEELNSTFKTQTDTEVNEIVQTAKRYASSGKLVNAEIEFSRALIMNPSENQLLSYADFLINNGQLAKATSMIDRSIYLANVGKNLKSLIRAYTLKGNILFTKGDLDTAQEMYQKALEIDEKLERPEGIANH